jgi:hypothetical protein
MKAQRSGSWAELRQLAEMFNDAQQFRMAEAGKARSGTIDADPEGLLAGVVGLYKKAETDLMKELVACYKATVPSGIRAWQESDDVKGVGAPTLARLLGVIGHPVHAEPKYWVGEGTGERQLVAGEPFDRTVGQLWAYCGYGDPGRRPRVKGISKEDLMAAGSPKAKTLTFLIAQGVVKAGIRNKQPVTQYGKLYYATKDEYRERVHSGPCPGGYGSAGGKVVFIKCKTGPEGAYAVAGDPFQPSHIEAIGYRRLCKEILRDLWVASRD